MDAFLSADAFGALLEQRLKEIPIVTVLAREELELRLEVGGRQVASNADAFYNAYRSAPDKQAEIIDAYAQLIIEEAPRERKLPPFEQVAPLVMPMLRRPDVLAQVRERELPMLVWTPFLADLIITYVIDQARSLSYINEEQLEQWELGEQEVHAQAVANLRQRTVNAQVTTVGEGAQRLYIYSSMDGYDATRLLLPDLMDNWQHTLPGQIVIGIPNRDFLIAFSDDDTGVLAAIARQVQLDTASRGHGLTDQLFTIRNGRIEEYEW